MNVPAMQPPRSCPELHVASLPFPSYQGTQAAIRSMLETRNALGTRAALYTYRTAGYAWTPSFALYRGPGLAQPSLRSGPSWAKVAADLGMGLTLPSLLRQTQAQVIIAHHVEAMSLACGVRALPRVFFAHTDLGAELPSYAPARCARPLRRAGAWLDRWLCTRADAIAAVSPLLCEQLRASTGVTPSYVPTPWSVPEAISAAERDQARRRLGLTEEAKVALYAGNLDAYQDAECTLDALAELAAQGGPRMTLLLATGSEPQPFLERAMQLGVPFRTYQLGAEPVRRMVHAAADLAIVPRAVPGGLPIKLLDALARGLACALTPLAAAGLPLADRALRAAAAGSSPLADAIARLSTQPNLRRALAEHARRYVAIEHSPNRFHSALEDVIAQARQKHRERLPVRDWSS